MDPEALRDEVETWVRDGIITESQAEAILARYDESDEGGRSRVVLALSIVGSALVFVGVTLFLATNWDDLPTAAQVAVLLAGPGLAYAGGIAAYRRSSPRIGLAGCLLGAILAGPSLFLLADTASIELAATWLLLGWTAIALPSGHALDSRLGVGIGIGLSAALVAELAGPADPVPPVALLGVSLFVLATHHRERVGWTYGMGGAALTLFGLLLLTTLDGRYGRFDVGPSAVLVATALGSLVGVGWLRWQGDHPRFEWTAPAVAAVGVSTGAAVLAPDRLPEIVAFLGGHIVLLGAIAATGYYGFRSGSQRFIDLAALAALAQTLSFVASTVIDALSGSLALVVAGLILLGAGVTLERGRRTLRSRLE